MTISCLRCFAMNCIIIIATRNILNPRDQQLTYKAKAVIARQRSVLQHLILYLSMRSLSTWPSNRMLQDQDRCNPMPRGVDVWCCQWVFQARCLLPFFTWHRPSTQHRNSFENINHNLERRLTYTMPGSRLHGLIFSLCRVSHLWARNSFRERTGEVLWLMLVLSTISPSWSAP